MLLLRKPEPKIKPGSNLPRLRVITKNSKKMEKIQDLLASLEEAKKKVFEIKESIRTFQDGYVYHVLISSFGAQTWDVHFNSTSVQQILDEYFTGDSGIVEVYTNNPNPSFEDEGCLRRLYSLEELPKYRQDISHYEGNINLVKKLKGIDSSI